LALLGTRDENLRTVEGLLTADVHVRGNEVTLTGSPTNVSFAEQVFGELLTLVERGQHVGTDTVRQMVHMLSPTTPSPAEAPSDVLSMDVLTRRGRSIRPKTLNQKEYVDAIENHTVLFGIRSEERRVGKECRWRGEPGEEKEKRQHDAAETPAQPGASRGRMRAYRRARATPA